MAFQPVPDVAHARIVGKADGQDTINDLYFEISGTGISPTSLLNIATALDAWASTQLAPLLSEDWQYLRTDATDLTAANSFQVSVGTPAVGGVTSEAAPNNVAACISFQTGIGGRSFRGRNYVPGIPNSAITLNTLSNTFMGALLTTYFMLAGAGTFEPGWQWVVVSRQTAGALRPSGIATPVINTVFTAPYVRSMRSREIGHGS